MADLVNGGASYVPPDLLKDTSTPDTDKNYFKIILTDLDPNTEYPLQFAWVYEDKSVSEYSATYKVTTSSTAIPSSISGLTANFRDASNNKTRNLYVRFTHDNSTTLNSGVDTYLIRLTYNKGQAGSVFKDFYLNGFDKTNSSKIYELSANDNSFYFGVFRNRFTVEVTPIDNTNNTQGTTIELLSDLYEITLNPPSITVTAGVGSYKVDWSNAEADVNKGWNGLIHIEESIGGGSYTGIASGNIKPIIITTSGATAYSARNVRARFSDGGDNFTGYSNIESVTPISADPTDSTPPGVPTVTFVSSTSTTITVNIVNADASSKAHRLRFKENGATLYQTDIVPYTGATTPYTFGGLKPNTTYNISAASYDNLNNLSAFSSPDINGTTQTLVANPPTGVTLAATASGVLASWTAPAVQPARVDRYKIELWQDLATDVLITTEFAFSTNISFGGLAAGTYYVKVQTQDMYGTLSTAVQSSSVSVTGVNPTDGQVPSSSPAATVNPLYGALEVKWTAIANADPVTYEVYLSPNPITGVVAGDLALRVTGTSAIIKTLPGTSTALAYGTTYYVRIRATDADGAATTLGTQGSATTLKVDNGDIAANAIRANVIQAGTITADQINSSALLANKTITVGARAAVVTAASVAGGNITYTTSGTHGFGNGTLVSVTGMSTAAFNITDFAIQSTTTNTFVVLVGGSGATGSLSNQTGVATSTVNTAIKIDASGTGLSASPFKFYSGTGTYADAGTSPGTPFYLDTNGRFSLRDRLFFDGSALTVNGTINAAAGNFSGAMTVNNGTMKIGTLAGGTAGTDGIYINTNNYWYSNGNIKIGGASNNVTWDGTTFKVTGEINAASGTITGNLTMTGAGSVIAKTTADSFNYVTLSYAGIFAYSPNAAVNPTSSVETTRIVSNAAAGAATLVTKAAKLGDTPGWFVDATSIYSNTAENGIKLDSTSPGMITARNGDYYVGIKPRVSADGDIVLWAGQSADGSVASFKVQSNGVLIAQGATITGSLSAGSGISLVKLGQNVSGTNHGLYVAGTQDYIYSDGKFKLGSNSSGTASRLLFDGTTLTIGGATTIKGGEITLDATGTLDTDNNNFSGDPTITINSTNKLTKGRRFIFNGATVPTATITLTNSQGTFTPAPAGSPTITVKVGDILMVS